MGEEHGIFLSIGFGLSFVFYLFMLLYYLIYKILWIPSEVPMKFRSGKVLWIKNFIDRNVLSVLLSEILISLNGFLTMSLIPDLRTYTQKDKIDFIFPHAFFMLLRPMYQAYRSGCKCCVITTILFFVVISGICSVAHAGWAIALSSMILEICCELTGLFVKIKLPFEASMRYITDKNPEFKFLEEPFDEKGFDTSKVFVCMDSHHFSAYKSMFEEFVIVDINYGIDTMDEPLKYRSIVYHELGHIFYDHLMKIKTFRIVGNTVIFVCLVVSVSQTIADKEIDTIIMGILSYLSILKTLFAYSCHLYEQSQEFQADKFSFEQMGMGTGEYLIESISELRFDASMDSISKSASAVFPPYFVFNTHPSLYHRHKNLEN